ncbi:isochorismatase family protein [Paenibacillus albiflavus]|uniref:Isochorismatase family protein n=1 Tax=Paenibacillus albiflavus TaxID=2545760 RepID=A0A4R4E8S0_9BACL|nr:isochorismatase family protein [Paenibacillus albiflavus]TCZ75250.1 isochorismatase family protein [Paenibacillus albiflavus]
MKAAFLVIDMQIGCFQNKGLEPYVDGASEYINAVANIFRDNGQPVIFVQDLEVDGGVGSSGFEIIPQIEVQESEVRIHKEFANSFWQTNLEELLRAQDVEFVLISGFAAEYCALFTYNGAKERGFNAAFLQHGVVGLYPESIQALYRDRPIVAYSIVDMLLKQ